VAAIDASLDRAALDAALALPEAVPGAAREVERRDAVARWALDVDGGREVSALVIGPVPAREVVVVAADGGVGGATIVPWLLAPERAVVVVEPTGVGSQTGPYWGVNDAGFGGHGKYAGGHPLLVGMTGMALLAAEVRAAADLARGALGAERVVLCGEGLGTGAAVIAIGAGSPGHFDAVVGVDGLLSYAEVAARPLAIPPALVARGLFDVGDLPDVATLLAPRPLLLVAPRDARLTRVTSEEVAARYGAAQLAELPDVGGWLDGL
jgi:hypothetical protein